MSYVIKIEGPLPDIKSFKRKMKKKGWEEAILYSDQLYWAWEVGTTEFNSFKYIMRSNKCTNRTSKITIKCENWESDERHVAIWASYALTFYSKESGKSNILTLGVNKKSQKEYFSPESGARQKGKGIVTFC